MKKTTTFLGKHLVAFLIAIFFCLGANTVSAQDFVSPKEATMILQEELTDLQSGNTSGGEQLDQNGNPMPASTFLSASVVNFDTQKALYADALDYLHNGLSVSNAIDTAHAGLIAGGHNPAALEVSHGQLVALLEL